MVAKSRRVAKAISQKNLNRSAGLNLNKHAMLLSVHLMVKAPPTSVTAPFRDGKIKYIKRSRGIAWYKVQRKRKKGSDAAMDLFDRMKQCPDTRWVSHDSGVLSANIFCATYTCIPFGNISLFRRRREPWFMLASF